MPGHRLFAAVYDRVLAGSEKAGLSAMRAELLSRAHGRTLELGAGTGHNLEHYGDAVTELVLTEPDPYMAKRLSRRAEDAGLACAVEVSEIDAEQLPFPDHSFDTVVCTLVLCTVENPQKVALEAARVLKPDGELLLIEHVRGEEGSAQARWQDRLNRPWGWFAGGCNANRDTAATLSAAFDVSDLQPDSFPKPLPWVEPLIRGPARPHATG